jgi:Phage QLRG family, putative DNA packaging.
MVLVSLEEAKLYLCVDNDLEDGLIQQILDTAGRLVMDVARVDGETLLAEKDITKPAVLYAAAFLYEHREEADYRGLLRTLRGLLFGIREEVF